MLTVPGQISALHPRHYDDVSFALFRSSLRLQGSMRMNLRRLSRSAEFSRQYLPGDPLSMLDWKAFARSDHLIVRQRRDEACARICIFVDLAESMNWPLASHGLNVKELPPTKLEVALRIATHLAASHLAAGDHVSCWFLGAADATVRIWRPQSPNEILSLFAECEAKGFGYEHLSRLFPSTQTVGDGRWDQLFWLSDALTPQSLMDDYCARFRSCHVHILSSLEADIAWLKDDAVYFDAGVQRKEYLGRILKPHDAYRQRLKAWCTGLAQTMHSNAGLYLPVTDRSAISAYSHSLQELYAVGNAGR